MDEWIDEDGFAALAERHRRELHVHCYRMVGSFTEAEDLVQETLLRAWRARHGFEGRASVRSWLYRIATNACLDALAHSSRRHRPVGTGGGSDESDDAFVPREPYPDQLLDGVGPPDGDPSAVAVSRETIELAFVAALAHLPPRQRAAFVIRDVLGWSAADAAADLGISVQATNSLVQRARSTLGRRMPRRDDVSPRRLAPDERVALDRYMEAHERMDAASLIAMLTDDVRITMPPEPACLGRAAAADFFAALLGPAGPGEWLLVPTLANRQPATLNYLRGWDDDVFRALSVDVLSVVDGEIAEVNCFLGAEAVARFGLPAVLTGAGGRTDVDRSRASRPPWRG